MANIENILDITPSPIEYCYLSEDQYFDNEVFKIKIPKLMPDLIPDKNISYNKNIFYNEKDSKPVANNVQLQTYITVPKSEHCSLQPIADVNGMVKKNTCVLCICMNGNIKDMRIIDYKTS